MGVRFQQRKFSLLITGAQRSTCSNQQRDLLIFWDSVLFGKSRTVCIRSFSLLFLSYFILFNNLLIFQLFILCHLQVLILFFVKYLKYVKSSHELKEQWLYS
jgi:hypothetical protein